MFWEAGQPQHLKLEALPCCSGPRSSSLLLRSTWLWDWSGISWHEWSEHACHARVPSTNSRHTFLYRALLPDIIMVTWNMAPEGCNFPLQIGGYPFPWSSMPTSIEQRPAEARRNCADASFHFQGDRHRYLGPIWGSVHGTNISRSGFLAMKHQCSILPAIYWLRTNEDNQEAIKHIVETWIGLFGALRQPAQAIPSTGSPNKWTIKIHLSHTKK